VLSLRVAVAVGVAERLALALRGTGGVHRISAVGVVGDAGEAILVADVEPAAADAAMAVLADFEVGSDDYRLARIDVIAPVPAARPRFGGAEVAWVEVLGEARANSRPLARYVALILAAGVIAALGVLTGNGILIVGAMAVSPDLLPICATCVGIVGRRGRLARRAFLTLLLGLVLVTIVAATVAGLLDLTGVLADDYQVGQGGLGGLAHLDYSTVLVALAAGVAAMLSFETRASAAVGVAISVTTIPASAYLGVALALGEHGAGAILVLAVNVVLLIASGSLTLAVQRAQTRRAQGAEGGGQVVG
jgi:uncharacterized hydrophobic protein (TIGR00271 family)